MSDDLIAISEKLLIFQRMEEYENLFGLIFT